MTLAERFRAEVAALAESHVRQLRDTLDYDAALALPAVDPRDVVVAGREVLLAIYRQADMPLPGQVLVTVQVSRHSLGGVVAFRAEKGLVFAPRQPPRDATVQELGT